MMRSHDTEPRGRALAFARALAPLGALALAFFSAAAPAREIVDMAGRRVIVPDHITRVYGSSPPATLMVYALAPETLIGLNTPFAVDKALLRREASDLPALGSQAGMGRTLNPEEVLARKPDIVIAWMGGPSDRSRAEETFAKLGLPVVFIRLDAYADYAGSFRFLGELFGRRDKADELASYIEMALARVAAAVSRVPEAERLRVYYAQNADGLATDCDASFHTEPIRLAGGVNVHHCEPSTHRGMEKIDLEQIVALQPNFILAQDKSFAESVGDNPAWRNVPGARLHRVALVPHAPFNWLDRPPGFMRALGVQWLANQFYPHHYPLDLKAETKKFFALFLGVELDDAAFARLLK
jgi:iron complex transport system substrate-binding protein